MISNIYIGRNTTDISLLSEGLLEFSEKKKKKKKKKKKNA